MYDSLRVFVTSRETIDIVTAPKLGLNHTKPQRQEEELEGRLPMAIKLHPSFAVHPGAWLRAEIVEPHGLNVTDAAARLRVTRQAMSNLLKANAGLSAEMAIRFEKGIWRQGRYDDADAGRAWSGAGEGTGSGD